MIFKIKSQCQSKQSTLLHKNQRRYCPRALVWGINRIIFEMAWLLWKEISGEEALFCLVVSLVKCILKDHLNHTGNCSLKRNIFYYNFYCLFLYNFTCSKQRLFNIINISTKIVYILFVPIVKSLLHRGHALIIFDI